MPRRIHAPVRVSAHSRAGVGTDVFCDTHVITEYIDRPPATALHPEAHGEGVRSPRGHAPLRVVVALTSSRALRPVGRWAGMAMFARSGRLVRRARACPHAGGGRDLLDELPISRQLAATTGCGRRPTLATSPSTTACGCSGNHGRIDAHAVRSGAGMDAAHGRLDTASGGDGAADARRSPAKQPMERRSPPDTPGGVDVGMRERHASGLACSRHGRARLLRPRLRRPPQGLAAGGCATSPGRGSGSTAP